MTYTAEQLREESDQRKAEGQHYLALIFSGYADALEENARLKEQMSDLHTGYTTTLKELTADRDSWMGQADMHSETAHKQMQRAERAEAELAKLLKSVQEFWEEKP